jgi:hypothetical protein
MITSAATTTATPNGPATPPATATSGMQTPRVAGLSGDDIGPRDLSDALVDAPVDLLLDPVDEAVDQLLVVGRPELPVGRHGRLQVAPGLLVHAPEYPTPDLL